MSIIRSTLSSSHSTILVVLVLISTKANLTLVCFACFLMVSIICLWLPKLERRILGELISVTLRIPLLLLLLPVASSVVVLLTSLSPVGLLASRWRFVMRKTEVTSTTGHVVDFYRSDAFRMV